MTLSSKISTQKFKAINVNYSGKDLKKLTLNMFDFKKI